MSISSSLARSWPRFGFLVLACTFSLLLCAFPVISLNSQPLPIVLWHGMGDTCCDDASMGYIIDLIKEKLPNVYVHSVKLGATPATDRWAGFFGNINSQLDHVCKELSENERLKGGFNAIGFSQGGLFLRSYVQRCNSPPIKTLVTFGSPHSGVTRMPPCQNPTDWTCNTMSSIASRGVYSWYVRNHVIPAQYFKDPLRYEEYLEYNIFLADINNDKQVNQTYIDNMVSLENLVMVRFTGENVVVPGTSTWFGFVDENGEEIPIRYTDTYIEDLLGLKQLDSQGKLVFLSNQGPHMAVSEELLLDILHKYMSPEPLTRFLIQG